MKEFDSSSCRSWMRDSPACPVEQRGEQEGHPFVAQGKLSQRNEGSLAGHEILRCAQDDMAAHLMPMMCWRGDTRSFAALRMTWLGLRMTKPDALFFEMD